MKACLILKRSLMLISLMPIALFATLNLSADSSIAKGEEHHGGGHHQGEHHEGEHHEGEHHEGELHHAETHNDFHHGEELYHHDLNGINAAPVAVPTAPTIVVPQPVPAPQPQGN